MFKKISLLFVSVFILLIVANSQYTGWKYIHSGNYGDLVQLSDGVMHGTPHWRAFQNRILSPLIIQGLASITTDPLKLFVKLALTALNAILFFGVWKKTNNLFASTATLLFASFCFFNNHCFWSASWDFSEAIMLLMLVIAVDGGWKLPAIALLFGISIFNRERGMFIPVYVVLLGGYQSWKDKAIAWRPILAGGAGLISGVLIVEALRKTLFKYSIIPNVGTDETHQAFENHFYLVDNILAINTDILHTEFLTPIWFLFFVTIFAALSIKGWKEQRGPVFALGVTMLGYMAAILCFGTYRETRLYQPLSWAIPFLFVSFFCQRKEISVKPMKLSITPAAPLPGSQTRAPT